jgi:hypothetical protein
MLKGVPFPVAAATEMRGSGRAITEDRRRGGRTADGERREKVVCEDGEE